MGGVGVVDRWAARLGLPGPRPVDRAVDVALVLAVAVASSVPFVTSRPGHVTALGVVVNLGTVLPLLWRRRAPFAVMVIVGACATLVSLHHRPGQNLQYGGLVAIYTVASLGRRRWQRLGVLVVIIVTFPPASLLLKDNDLDEFMFTMLLPLAAFLLGSLERTRREHAETLRERAEQLERERIAEAARGAAEERARVARDMHDILAHAVSLMVVQAEAGPVVVRSDPQRAEQTFEAIADAGRDAMAQLRRLLGVLKTDEAELVPQPTLAQLPELVAGTAELEVTGQPRPVPPDTELAVYRIVQEALTNTVKHADAQHVAVQLDWSADQLTVTVTDDGRGRHSGEGHSSGRHGGERHSSGRHGGGGHGGGGSGPVGGHGLVGIAERVTACGGTATAGPRPGGGFEVRAALPYGPDAR